MVRRLLSLFRWEMIVAWIRVAAVEVDRSSWVGDICFVNKFIYTIF